VEIQNVEMMLMLGRNEASCIWHYIYQYSVISDCYAKLKVLYWLKSKHWVLAWGGSLWMKKVWGPLIDFLTGMKNVKA